MTDKKGMLYCLRVFHDNYSWVEPFWLRKDRGAARKMYRDMGFYCETVDVR